MTYLTKQKNRLKLYFYRWLRNYLLISYFQNVGANIERFCLICDLSDEIEFLEGRS